MSPLGTETSTRDISWYGKKTIIPSSVISLVPSSPLWIAWMLYRSRSRVTTSTLAERTLCSRPKSATRWRNVSRKKSRSNTTGPYQATLRCSWGGHRRRNPLNRREITKEPRQRSKVEFLAVPRDFSRESALELNVVVVVLSILLCILDRLGANDQESEHMRACDGCLGDDRRFVKGRRTIVLDGIR